MSIKYVIGYNDHDVMMSSWCHDAMIGYVKRFDSNKTVSFKFIDIGLLKRYVKIWDGVIRR